MTYLKPNPFARKVFNPIALRFGIGGSESLEVACRRSGGRQRLPVIPVEHEGAHYVVSARGESDWVKNCRAAGAVELGGRRMRATEVPVTERDAIITAYREKAGKTVDAYWKKLPDASDHPVFRLEPVNG
jgi:hypothetical protein